MRCYPLTRPLSKLPLDSQKGVLGQDVSHREKLQGNKSAKMDLLTLSRSKSRDVGIRLDPNQQANNSDT